MKDQFANLADELGYDGNCQVEVRFDAFEYELLWQLQSDELVDRALMPQTTLGPTPPPATARHLAPVDRAIKAELLQAGELEIDETPIDYQDPGRGSVKDGRLWAYLDPVAGTCYFDWHAGRGAGCLLEMLGYDQVTNTIAYEGTIHTDGYGVYDAVASRFGLRHGGCLAHARRKFTDLAPEVTLPVLLFIQRIYQIEKQTRQTAAPPACREPRSRGLPRRGHQTPSARRHPGASRRADPRPHRRRALDHGSSRRSRLTARAPTAPDGPTLRG